MTAVSHSPVSTAVTPFNRRRAQSVPLRRPALVVPPLWQLTVAQLDETRFDYTPDYLARLLGISAGGVRKYCRKLFPANGCKYLLDFSEACVLIYAACRDGRTLDAEKLFAHLLEEKRVGADFPRTDATVQRACRAIQEHRARRSALTRPAEAGSRIPVTCP